MTDRDLSKPGVMFIAAHQDDAEGLSGGLFAKHSKVLKPQGLVACFTDGSVGHYKTDFLKDCKNLVNIRDKEASNAASVYGFKYQRLIDCYGDSFKDGRLEVDWKSRGAVWKIIRDFQPDLIVTLPVNNVSDPYGMHNDHTNVGEIVKRTAYLIPAPLAFPEYVPEDYVKGLKDDDELDFVKPPIIVTAFDPYSGKIQPDIVIELTEDELDIKARAWAEHLSQWKEWLPWIAKYEPPTDFDALRKGFIGRSRRLASAIPVELDPNKAYESFTITNWALRIPTLDEIKRYFPYDVLDYKFAEKKIAELEG